MDKIQPRQTIKNYPFNHTNQEDKFLILERLKQGKYKKSQPKLSPKLSLGRFITGCVVIWVLAVLIIQTIGAPSKKKVNAEFYIGYDSELIPDVKFNDLKNKKGVVAGVYEDTNHSNQNNLADNQAINTPNPYQKYENVADLYSKNPKFVRDVEKKITEYIDQYRSREGTDQRFDVPVESIIFLEVSLKYQIPLSYTLAIARLESRFGTDCFSQVGATRICKHRNVYSLGLDDSGNNWTFENWDDGVYAFGKWYQKHVNEGYTTCQIWRTYNPNGDYCKKVLDMAMDIEKYFNQ